jgi:hypothetical protein
MSEYLGVRWEASWSSGQNKFERDVGIWKIFSKYRLRLPEQLLFKAIMTTIHRSNTRQKLSDPKCDKDTKIESQKLERLLAWRMPFVFRRERSFTSCKTAQAVGIAKDLHKGHYSSHQRFRLGIFTHNHITDCAPAAIQVG